MYVCMFTCVDTFSIASYNPPSSFTHCLFASVFFFFFFKSFLSICLTGWAGCKGLSAADFVMSLMCAKNTNCVLPYTLHGLMCVRLYIYPFSALLSFDISSSFVASTLLFSFAQSSV